MYTLPRQPVQMSKPHGSCFNRSRLWGSAWNAHSEAHTLLKADLTPLCPVLGLRPGSGKLSSPGTNVCRSNPKIQSSSVLFKTLAAKSCLRSTGQIMDGFPSVRGPLVQLSIQEKTLPCFCLCVYQQQENSPSYKKRIPPATSPICSLEKQAQLTLKISRPPPLQGRSSRTCGGCHF